MALGGGAVSYKRGTPVCLPGQPLSSEHGTHKIVQVRVWRWLEVEVLETFQGVPFDLEKGCAGVRTRAVEGCCSAFRRVRARHTRTSVTPQYPKPETRNLKPETRNPKPGSHPCGGGVLLNEARSRFQARQGAHYLLGNIDSAHLFRTTRGVSSCEAVQEAT